MSLKVQGPLFLTRPKAYSLRFKPFGWAIFTINDVTGEFSIQSDWGIFGHRWNVDALGGASLTAFLYKAENDYIVHKMKTEGNKDLAPVVDVDKTDAAIKREICEMRREGVLNKELAREAWDACIAWKERDFVTDALPEDLHTLLDAPWELIVTKPSPTYLFLRDELLPVFFKELKHLQTQGDAPA